MTYRNAAKLVFGLVLALAASVALFYAIQYSVVYIAALRGQFYTPLPNPSTGISGLLDRATSRAGLLLLRYALWPFLIFLVLQCGAGYSISRVVTVEGNSAARRLRSGFFVSLGVTALCLAAVWASFLRTARG